MNLRQALGKNRRQSDAEINVTPVMNIFVILIPFLLLTATFVKIAIINLALPSLEQGQQIDEEALKDLTLILISIKPEGFEVKTSEQKFPLIRRKDNGEFDFRSLRKILTELKKKYPQLEDVVISPASEIKYQVIVKVLDNCREVGFPNFSISG